MSNRPSWENAPDWANWLAMDKAGEWYWFENEPQLRKEGYWSSNDSKCRFAGHENIEYEDSLQSRPDPKS